MRMPCLLYLGACALFQQSSLLSATDEGNAPVHSYPWAESSEYVRVGKDLLDLGVFEMRIDVETVRGPDGRETRRIRYESDRPERGSSSGPRLRIPERFRHVLTPEMLEPKGPPQEPNELPKVL